MTFVLVLAGGEEGEGEEVSGMDDMLSCDLRERGGEREGGGVTEE